jgi:hypothetical protein
MKIAVKALLTNKKARSKKAVKKLALGGGEYAPWSG